MLSISEVSELEHRCARCLGASLKRWDVFHLMPGRGTGGSEIREMVKYLLFFFENQMVKYVDGRWVGRGS